jgi:hypothetical protein
MPRITAASLTGEATTSSALVEMLPRFRQNLATGNRRPGRSTATPSLSGGSTSTWPRDRSILRRYGGCRASSVKRWAKWG